MFRGISQVHLLTLSYSHGIPVRHFSLLTDEAVFIQVEVTSLRSHGLQIMSEGLEPYSSLIQVQDSSCSLVPPVQTMVNELQRPFELYYADSVID